MKSKLQTLLEEMKNRPEFEGFNIQAAEFNNDRVAITLKRRDAEKGLFGGYEVFKRFSQYPHFPGKSKQPAIIPVMCQIAKDIHDSIRTTQIPREIS